MRLASAGRIALFVRMSSVAARAQEASSAQQFSVTGHGSLVLSVPTGWRVAARTTERPSSVSLRFGPASGDAFSVQVTSVWLDPSRSKMTPASIKERLQNIAADALSGAVEKEANLTVLHRDPGAAEKETALRMFADATYSKAEPAAASPQVSQSIQVEKTGEGYQVTVPISRLVMTIPGGGLKQKPGTPGSCPRYFHLADESRAINASGWFESAQRFPGVRKFWEDEAPSLTHPGTTEPQEVSFTKVDRWDVVIYEMRVPVPEVTNSHVRAHWVEAGTWIDLHLSVTSRQPRDESRAVLLQMLKSIRVKEKG